MIEVEKKFILGDKERTALLEGAEYVGVKKFTDVYYDTAAYDLTKKDWWLRARDGRFELKIPTGGINSDADANSYEELEDDAGIKNRLKLYGEGDGAGGVAGETAHDSDAGDAMDLEELLSSSGYQPFAIITTTREKYKKSGFNIDIDEVDYGYQLAEIEAMVEGMDDEADAKKRIFEFAGRHGLKIEGVRGKVLEYLSRRSPEHLQALEAAWGKKI